MCPCPLTLCNSLETFCVYQECCIYTMKILIVYKSTCFEIVSISEHVCQWWNVLTHHPFVSISEMNCESSQKERKNNFSSLLLYKPSPSAWGTFLGSPHMQTVVFTLSPSQKTDYLVCYLPLETIMVSVCWLEVLRESVFCQRQLQCCNIALLKWASGIKMQQAIGQYEELRHNTLWENSLAICWVRSSF